MKELGEGVLFLLQVPVLSLPPREASVLSLLPENWLFLLLKVSFLITINLEVPQIIPKSPTEPRPP